MASGKLCALFLVLVLLLPACALQPVVEPRRVDFANEPTPLPVQVEAEKPTYVTRSGTVSERLTLTGRVGSAIEQPLLAEQSGTVSAVLVSNGAAIVAGDVIALLDSRELDAEIAALQRAIAGIRQVNQVATNALNQERMLAELRVQRANLALGAARERGVTPTELELLQTDIEIAEAELLLIGVPSAENQVELVQLETQLAERQALVEQQKLIASADGDLTDFNLRVGSRVQAGDPIGTLLRVDQPLAWATANEGQLGRLDVGQSVALSLPNNDGNTFVGKIVQLPFPHGEGSARVGAVGVDSAELPPFGERINLTVIIAERDNTLWLPPAALREFAGQPFVIVRDGDNERRVDIELGLTSAGRTEIVDGLQEGDIVVAP